jgi:hypothetical protein
MLIPVLIAAAVAVALTRKGDTHTAGAQRWFWDPERWRRDSLLHLHDRRWLVWDPRVNAWSSAQQMGVQPQAATSWVPATMLRHGRLYRFAGTNPGLGRAQLLGAIGAAGWRVRHVWHVGTPMPVDYPVGGAPSALSDPSGYVVEAFWLGETQGMQEGIEAPVEYVTIAQTGFLPPRPAPPRGRYMPPRPAPPRLARPRPPPPRMMGRRPWAHHEPWHHHHHPHYPYAPGGVVEDVYAPPPVIYQQPSVVQLPGQTTTVYQPVPSDGGAPYAGPVQPPDGGGPPPDGGQDDAQPTDDGGQPPPNDGQDGGGSDDGQDDASTGWYYGYGAGAYRRAPGGFGRGVGHPGRAMSSLAMHQRMHAHQQMMRQQQMQQQATQPPDDGGGGGGAPGPDPQALIAQQQALLQTQQQQMALLQQQVAAMHPAAARAVRAP